MRWWHRPLATTRRRRTAPLHLETLEPRVVLNGGPVISELLANNHRNLQDFDDDWSDWIEVANTDSTPVDLGGYYLTDDAGNLDKWSFPAGTVLDGGGQLVVFASNKDYVAPSGELHTNFKLRSEGEFLALVERDGVTIAAQFDSPLPGGGTGFPAQAEDISYGLAPAGDTLQYFAEPTPGAANGAGQRAVASVPEFSTAGGTFVDPFELELTTDVPGGVIHYTLDQTLPTADAPIYDPAAPLMITNTTQVRAMVAAPDHVTSPVVSRTYIKLAQDMLDFTSSIPIVVLDNFGENNVSQPFPPAILREFRDAYWAIFDTQGEEGRSSLVQKPDMETRAGVRRRGESSSGFSKTGLRLEAWDELDRDKAVSPLGLPAEADWILNARSEYDRSLMSNSFMYALSNAAGHYAVRTRFVELFINRDAGELSRDDYYGVFTLMEKVERGKERVDVEKLAKNYDTEPLLTGGYILKFDPENPGSVTFTAGGKLMSYDEPTGAEMLEPIRAPQRTYIQGYLDDMAASLSNADPDEGYPAFIDVGSWTDYHLLSMFSKNSDAFGNSTFLAKRRQGKLEFGPIWDFDRALGSERGYRNKPVEGWPGRDFTTIWFDKLLANPDFRQQYIDRYQQLRAGPWNDANIGTIFDDLAAELTVEAAQRNFERWPRWLPKFPLGAPSWPGEVERLRQWVLERFDWIDGQLISQPIIVPSQSGADGTVPRGTTVTLSLPDGAPEGATILYTLDGSDPRAESHTFVLPDPWDLLSDFATTAAGTFVVDLANGQYDVTLRQGDRFEVRDEMVVTLEDTQVDVGRLDAGQFSTITQRVEVADGQLTLSVEDQGGATAAAVLSGLEITPVAPAAVLAFDFGPSDAAVADGFDSVGDEPFDAGRGYGWTSGTLNLKDRGEPDPLRSDFVAVTSASATFSVDLSNGRYFVTTTMGDNKLVRDEMEVRLEPEEAGEVVDVVTVAAGQFQENTYTVGVNDGQLNVQIQDLGGDNGRAVINGLVISPVLLFDFGTETSPVEVGYVQVAGSSIYSAAIGYGWSTGTIQSVDRNRDLAAGIASPSALEYRGEPIVIAGPTTIHARTRLPNSSRSFVLPTQSIDWSGPSQMSLNTTAVQLAITELGYHPADPSVAESQVDAGFSASDFEFIELQNIGSGPIQLDGYAFTNGVDLTLPSAVLEAGQYGVVVSNLAAFEARYGTEKNVLGQYSGKLKNSGERLALADAEGNTLADFEYGDDDPWPVRADGPGATLELIDPAGTPAGQYGKYYRWRGSTEQGGSPAAAGVGPIGVVISEVVSRGDESGSVPDAIELHNTTGQAIDIGGWSLSDAAGNLLKYTIPAGTTLTGGAYAVFDEADFNPAPDNPGPNDFALDGTQGDDVWLVQSDGAGNVTMFVDDVHFPAAATGGSLGRVASGPERLGPLARVTLAAANGTARIGPVVISEIQYHPGPPTAAALQIDPALETNDLEFVELHNPTPVAVDLGGWELAGTVQFTFAAGTTLAADQTLVVLRFDPQRGDNADRLAAFRAHYGLAASVPLVGGYRSGLGNSWGLVQLLRADDPPPGNPAEVPLVLVDETVYDDLPPWPAAADGLGQSLQRTSAAGYGPLAASWWAGDPRPGEAALAQLGDLDLDGDVDFDDIDDLVLALTDADAYQARHGVSELVSGDLDRSGAIDEQDIALLVALLRQQR